MAYFDLKNYVTVAERLKSASEQIVSILTDQPTMLSSTVGVIRVVVTLTDGRVSSGTASFQLDLEGKSAQATSPIETAETNALGRALVHLGYSSVRTPANRYEHVNSNGRSAFRR